MFPKIQLQKRSFVIEGTVWNLYILQRQVYYWGIKNDMIHYSGVYIKWLFILQLSYEQFFYFQLSNTKTIQNPQGLCL